MPKYFQLLFIFFLAGCSGNKTGQPVLLDTILN